MCLANLGDDDHRHALEDVDHGAVGFWPGTGPHVLGFDWVDGGHMTQGEVDALDDLWRAKRIRIVPNERPVGPRRVEVTDLGRPHLEDLGRAA